MDLDVIVVLCLGLPFFGGISYLIWKNRKWSEPPNAEKTATLQDEAQGAGRRKR